MDETDQEIALTELEAYLLARVEARADEAEALRRSLSEQEEAEMRRYLNIPGISNIVDWPQDHLYATTNNTNTMYHSSSYSTNLDTYELSELRETVRSLQRELREIKELLSNTVKQKEALEHRKLSI